MKSFCWMVAGFSAAAIGLILWDQRRAKPVEQLAHRLESAWSDHHTVV